jgi:hypothetical protein
MRRYSEASWERAIKIREVILRAMASKRKWWRAWRSDLLTRDRLVGEEPRRFLGGSLPRLSRSCVILPP